MPKKRRVTHRRVRRVSLKPKYVRVRRGRPVVLIVSATQTGRSNIGRDKRRYALKPGKRRSAAGRIYYEKRANRSDRSHKRRL